jgi:C-terminal processing protease CtpA/Prc
MSKRLIAASPLLIFVLTFVLTFVLILAGVIAIRAAQAPPSSGTLSLEDRALMASKIYRIVSTFFPLLTQEKFDAAYAAYLARVLKTDDRREFDLLSMEFIADLHDGHTWFYDNWLDQNFGQPVGFIAYPLDENLKGKWTVIRTRLDSLQVGDVISAIDSVSIDDYFASHRKYVSASSDRDAGVSFFDTPSIFPEKFTLTLSDGRQVAIDRNNDKKKDEPAAKTEGRWLTEGSVAYIKVPTFHGIDTQAQAIDYFRQFHSAKAVILDVRGNPGLGQPTALQSALIDKPYKSWMESTSMKGGALLRNYNFAYPEHSEITTTDAIVSPRDPVYTGRLILLIDRGCTCACEDFVMPFKFAKRAELVGEATAGTFSFTHFTAFDNGMLLNIAAVHHTFPDGTPFEGVGNVPDVAVPLTPEDLKANRDVVLNKALELAKQN